MKKIIYIVTVLLLVGASSANAQKFGHFDSRSVFSDMPEKAAADKSVGEFISEREKELEKMKIRYQRNYEEYIKERDSLSQEGRNAREKELQAMLEAMESFQQDAEQNAMAKQSKLYEEISKKIKDSISKIAKAQGLTYVLDTGTLLYFEGGVDITAAVRKELALVDKPKTVTPNPTPQK